MRIFHLIKARRAEQFVDKALSERTTWMCLSKLNLLISSLLCLLSACTYPQPATTMNRLSTSSSPYLLQHKDNPVHWQPWDQQALNQAKAENKLLLISIGYSSCHWCHVMEHESFEDDSVAKVMNDNFVCIKVDREERPDIDQVYMSAVQLMTGRGGWPLNCIALPDGRPVWGGTYFPKANWVDALSQLAELYEKDSAKMEEYAQKLQDGMKESESILDRQDEQRELNAEVLENALVNWRRRMDSVWGGPDKAPKFPLPNNELLLLDILHSNELPWLEDHLRLTLDRMAMGGIYDQIGGGFARYSTDEKWKVPHFEKMLYDNAQLIQLYSRASRQLNNKMYLRIAQETVEWAEREMKSEEGLYYSALDADSEGEEGLFYTWSAEQLDDFERAHPEIQLKDWFLLNEGEEWEGRFILQAQKTDEEHIKSTFKSSDEFLLQWNALRKSMLEVRSSRVRPGLDNKVLCSWNAMMISGLCSLFEASKEEEYRKLAVKVFSAVESQLMADSQLKHAFGGGRAYGEAMLDDYAFLVRAGIDVNRITGDASYLLFANSLMNQLLERFEDPDSPMLWFSTDSSLVLRTKENEDNVIPAANSQMARNFYDLGLLFGKPEWIERSKNMLVKVVSGMERYPEGYSNWGALLHFMTQEHYELAIVGEEAEQFYFQYLEESPNAVLVSWSKTPAEIGIFKDRYVEGKTLLYLCEEGACQMPVDNWEALNGQLKRAQ